MKALLRRARALDQIGNLEAALRDMTIVCIHKSFCNRSSLLMADKVFDKLVKHNVREHLANKTFVMPSKHFIKTFILSFSKDPVFSRLEHLEDVPEFFKKPLQALKDEEYNDIIPLCTEIIKRSEFDTLPSSKLEVLLLRATFYYILGKLDSAIQDFECILTSLNASDDIKINVLIKRAVTYMQLQIPEKAFKNFELAVNINPRHSDIYYHKGQANFIMGRINDAKCDFEKAFEYNPNFSMAYMEKYYMDHNLALFCDNKELAKAVARDFQRAFEKRAHENLNLTECVCYYVLFAEMMSATQQYLEADTYFAKAIMKDPKNAGLLVTRIVHHLLWKGNVDKAIQHIQKAMDLDEKCGFAYEVLGIIEIRRENIEEAIRLFDKALVCCSSFVELTCLYGLREIAKIQLDIKKQLGSIPRSLRPFTRFIDIQHVEESDKLTDDDWTLLRLLLRLCAVNFISSSSFITRKKEDRMKLTAHERQFRMQPNLKTLQMAQKHKNEGNIYFANGKYDEAIAQYSKAIDICPEENVFDLAIFYQNRAATYEQLKNYSAVKAECTKALELNPIYIKALYRRARALEQMGDLKAALDDVTTVCIYEGMSNSTSVFSLRNIMSKLGQQHLYENCAHKKFFMPSKHIIEIYIMSFSKDPVFSRLQTPENIPKFFKKPLQALKDRKYDDIIPLCTEVIKRSEFDTILPSFKLEVLLLRATFYLLLGDYDDAIQDFESILTSKDASSDVRINALIKKATMYMQLGMPEISIMDFQVALLINPGCSDVYYRRGQVQLLLQSIDEAKNDFEKAFEYNPNFNAAYIQKCYFDYCFALSNRDVKSVNAAVRNFERVFEKYQYPPEYICCCILYAEMMSGIQQYQKSDTYFAKAIEKDPENALVYVQRGLIQMKWIDNVDKTIEYLKKALELDKNCRLAYEALGIIEADKGHLEEAMRLFDKALSCCCSVVQIMHVYSSRYFARTKQDVYPFVSGPDGRYRALSLIESNYSIHNY